LPSRETRRWKHWAERQQERVLRQGLKPKRKPSRVRKKGWLSEQPADSEDSEFDNTIQQCGFASSERVMPVGEHERREANLARASALFSEETSMPQDKRPLLATGTSGVVLEVSTSLCRVDVDGRELLCNMRGSLTAAETGFTNVVAVGDRVQVEETSDAQGIVTAVQPRRSALARPDVFRSHLQQVIVANADQLLIVAAWREPAIWLELIDRYLIAAERSALAPTICINKVDLASSLEDCREAAAPYLQLGYRVLFTSATRGDAIDELRQCLLGKTTVLAGLSGVGKSSLLQAVQPGLQLRISHISERHHAGRHTTSQVNMLRLQGGGFVVDTPGIREFGLAGLHRRDLVQYYPEIAALAVDCRFTDCEHIDEPDCAVRAGISQNLVAGARYHSYRKILSELPG